MERKVAIVRWWVALLAVVALALWEPSLWFGVVPLFFFPSCLCCGVGCATCADSFAGDMQVIYTGFANGTGFPADSAYKCADAFNATHILTPVSACNWELTGPLYPVTIFCTSVVYIIRMTHELSGSNYKSFVKIWYCESQPQDAGASLTFEYDHGTTQVNCADFTSLAMTKTETGQNCGVNCDEPTALFPCDVVAVTCTLSAI